MAKSKYTEETLRQMGLVEVEPGVYKSVNKGKTSPFIESVKNGDKLVVREKVVETPDFTAKVKTEWFIRGYSVPSKKNSRQNFVRNGKQISIPSKNHAEYVKMTSMQYEIFGIEFRKAVQVLGLEYPLNIEFTFIRDSKRRFDYCNACQTVEDIMVANKWIEDDSADFLIPSFGKYRIDKENPGVIIKILTNK